MSITNALRVENLSLAFQSTDGTIPALNNVSFEIKSGETLALLGESGSGKSLTALAIMQLLPGNCIVKAGSQIILGESLLTQPEYKIQTLRGKSMAMIFQEPMTSLNPVMTIRHQLAESLIRCDKDPNESALLALLSSVGLSDAKTRLDQYPHQLSGGMKQRIVIAMALAASPDLLIADEPTTALDVTIQAQILQLLKQIQQEHQMAILLITHDLGVAQQVADNVAVMYAGQIVEIGATQQILTNPVHDYTKRLLACLPSLENRGRLLPTAQINNHHEEISAEIKSTSLKSLEKMIDVVNLSINYPVKQGLFRRNLILQAVDNIKLSIEMGKTLALVGESGCGKSSVAMALLNLIAFSAETFQLSGQSVKSYRLNELRRKIQIIFQDPFSAMDPRLTVREILCEGMQALSTATKEEQENRAAALINEVGLSESTLSRYPHEFSGGQRQRISIARALMVAPELLVLDEPTSALDVSVQAQILNLLKRLQKENQLTYLFISHNISVVAYMADTVAVMYLGKIVEYAEAEKILEHPKHPYTQALLAAIPKVDEKQPLKAIRGEPPSRLHPPAGCHFHPRCPFVMEKCRLTYPPMFDSDGVKVACYLYENEKS